ncbi:MULTISPECIES: hypothetical protein [unclassified Spirulina]|nr:MULTISPECIES: hypothetical protein [Spirulina]MEA5469774.1 hypothetical protein [Spirulina sp. 06S082]
MMRLKLLFTRPCSPRTGFIDLDRIVILDNYFGLNHAMSGLSA